MEGAWHGSKWMTDVEWEHTAKADLVEPKPGRVAPQNQKSWIASMLETAASCLPWSRGAQALPEGGGQRA